MSDTKFALLMLGFFIAIRWTWTITVTAMCTYVVFWLGHSGWWFAFAVFLLVLTAGGDSDIATAKKVIGL